MRVLVIDNYDSFVHNLVQYLGQLGAECEVWRNDAFSLADIGRSGAAGVLLSPGPGSPAEAGQTLDAIRAYADILPILGVCLGHQAIGEAYGATVGPAPELLHGQTSTVRHHGQGVLAGLPDPFTATRYHSLTVLPDTLPDELEATGWTDSGVIMAMRHRTLPLDGVQFHPESVLSEGGHLLLANWLASCGHPSARDRVPELAAQVELLRRSAFAN